MVHAGHEEQAREVAGCALVARVDAAIPGERVVAGRTGVARAVVHDDLATAVAHGPQIVLVRRHGEGDGALAIAPVGGADPGQHRLDVGAQCESPGIEGGGILRRHFPEERQRSGTALQAVGEQGARPAGPGDAGVPREACIEPCALAVGGAPEVGGDLRLLLRRQAGAVAGAGTGGHVALQVECVLARRAVLHHPIHRSIERVATREHRLRNHGAFRGGEASGDVGLRGGERGEHLRSHQVVDGGQRQVELRVADEEAVVLAGQARCGHEGQAAAIGTSAEVGPVRSAPVGGADERLGKRRELLDGLVPEIESRLRIDAEGGIRRAGMPAIRAEHGEAHAKGVVHGTAASHRPGGRNDHAVRSPVALVVEASVPLQRQAQFEGDRIVPAVDRTPAFVHASEHLAVPRHGGAPCAQRALRNIVDRGDPGVRERQPVDQGRAVLRPRAGGQGGKPRRRWGGAGATSQDQDGGEGRSPQGVLLAHSMSPGSRRRAACQLRQLTHRPGALAQNHICDRRSGT